MEYIRGLESFSFPGRTAVTLGKFDGLHRGHQKLIWQICRMKKERHTASVVFAFDMQPFFEKTGKTGAGIMTNEERRSRLDGKVDFLLECPFSDDILSMEAEDFLQNVLHDLLHAACVVVGPDFHFGHGKRGDVQMLRDWAEKLDYELLVVPKEVYGDREISSSYIREELRKGNMKKVSAMLGYPYTVEGTVEHGAQLGRKYGFPTVNIHPAPEKLLPPNGVYMAGVKLDGIWYNGIGNIGYKPTVSSEHRMLIECHLLDYQGNAYGKDVQIQLYEFRRPEMKFASMEEWKAQIDSDIAWGEKYFQYRT